MLKLLGGRFKGKEVEGYNLLSGSLESDKIFNGGDGVNDSHYGVCLWNG